MKSIDMYILHDSSVGVCFARERDDASHRQSRHFIFFFPRSPPDGGVGHVLVLVFAATRRHLERRAAWVGASKLAAMMLSPLEILVVKASYTI